MAEEYGSDRAVFGICEIIVLAFMLPPGEALYRGDVFSPRMVGFFLFGGIWMVAGVTWPKLKEHVGAPFAHSVASVAGDFRWWFLARTLWPVFFFLYLEITKLEAPNISDVLQL
jgi:hypothetical protein